MPLMKCHSRARFQEAVQCQIVILSAERSTNIAFDQDPNLILDRFGLS